MSRSLPVFICLLMMLVGGVPSRAAEDPTPQEEVSGDQAEGKDDQPQEKDDRPEEKAAGSDEDEASPAAVEPPRPLFRLDVSHMKDGNTPVGANAMRGQWRVSKATGEITTGEGDLVEGWLEFGPKVREAGAAIRAAVLAPGAGRLRSRAGVGLYGQNGFQIRAVMVSDRVELVRRGEVLAAFPKALDPARWLQMELQAVSEGAERVVTARAWHEDEERPVEAQLKWVVDSEKLLFPLAGRALLTATPFSREAVRFRSVEVHAAPYEPVSDESKSSVPASLEVQAADGETSSPQGSDKKSEPEK